MAQSGDGTPVSIEITFDLPFALYSEGEFEVHLQHGIVNIRSQRVRQERFDPRIGIERGDFDVEGDRYGLVSYSKLTMQMEWPTCGNIGREVRGSTNVQVLQRVASYVANRVVESYRVATKTPWVSPN